MLEPEHNVEPQLLGGGNGSISANGVLMVDADLRKAAPVEHLKLVLQDLHCVSEKLFVVQSHLHHMVAQAFALGATAVVSRPREVIPKLAADRSGAAGGKSRHCRCLARNRRRVRWHSRRCSPRRGKANHSRLSDAENATSEIISSIEQKGLGAWLDDVRRYHQGTFQHCLLVTGVAVGFALDIRFPPADVKRLGLAATLHDIGKARIPLSILDKPGRLDPERRGDHENAIR